MAPPTITVPTVRFRSQPHPLTFPHNDANIEFTAAAMGAGTFYAQFDIWIPSETLAASVDDPFDTMSPFFAFIVPVGPWLDWDGSDWWWRIQGIVGESFRRAIITADAWITVKIALVGTTSTRDITIEFDGLSAGPFTRAGFESFGDPIFNVGWFNNGSKEPTDTTYVYVRGLKIGTTDGGSDILLFDGDLAPFTDPPDNFQSGVGNVEVLDPEVPPAVRAGSELWRFIVTGTNSQTLSLLDNRATGRRVVFTLNAPAYHEGQVGSDDPEINIPWPTGTSPAFLAPNTRLIYGFQREPGADPPWVCRFGGIVMSIEDEGADVPTSRYTAYDPWQLLMARPIRFEGTPFALPGVDGLTFPSGSRASDIAGLLLLATELEDGETHIDVSDLSLIHDTDPLAADITFDQGTSVGEAWQQLCDTGTLDIVLEPMYEPITAPGKLVRFSTWKPPNAAAIPPEPGGDIKYDAVMGWDRAGKSLTGISRLVDGTRLANVVQFYANQTPVPVQSDAASIAAVGQYWAQQFFPGTGNTELVALMAVAELAIRRNGQRSISLDPGPERTVIALRDYNLRDYVPVWASRRLREPIGG